MHFTLKILTLIFFALGVNLSSFAEVIGQNELNFVIDTKSMGDKVYFSFAQLKVPTLLKNYPELAKLDSLNMLKKKDAYIVVSKVAYIVKKPIGFFDHDNLSKEVYVQKTLDSQTVRKLSNDTFKVSSKSGPSYQLKTFFDSDEVSTLPNSKVIEAVSAFKKLDVISQSASAIQVREMDQFSGYAWGAVTVSSFIPFKEDKTLVISYYLTSVKKEFADKKGARASLKAEVASLQKIIENYQAP